MGGDGRRVPLFDGMDAASDVVNLIAGECRRSVVAGSIRRGKPTVGDVELVVVPTLQPSLFGGGDTDVLYGRLCELTKAGDEIRALDAGKPGARYRKLQHVRSGLQVDLFIVRPPASFGLLLMIRTGSAEFSHAMLGRANGLGMSSIEGALHRQGPPCTEHITTTKKCRHCAGRGWLPGERVDTPEEADVFAVLGLAFIDPQDRHDGRAIAKARLSAR